MKLFIGVPFYSHHHYLKRTLQSVVEQTDPSWELTVFDDSTDPAEAIAAEKHVVEMNSLLKSDKIRYQKNSVNLGMAKNWNQILEAGEYADGVTILHADDLLSPNYVSRIREAFHRYKSASVFFCKTQIVNRNDTPTFSFADWYKDRLLPRERPIILRGSNGIKTLIKGNFIFCPTMCFLTRGMKGRRFNSNYKMVLDLDFIFKALLDGREFIGLYDEPLYFYRRHDANATALMTVNQVRFHEEIELLRQYEAYSPHPLRIVQFNLLYQIVRAALSLQFGSMRSYLHTLKTTLRFYQNS